MLRLIGVCGLLLLLGKQAQSQQPRSPTPPSVSIPNFNPSIADLAKIEDGINGSYYHPDDLSGLDCGATVGWSDLLKQFNQATVEDKVKVLDGMRVELHAERGKPAAVSISWLNGTPANSATLETSTTQMLAGFFQLYWNIVASSVGPAKKDTVRIEAREGGGYTLHFASAGASVTEEIGADLLPLKIDTATPALQAEMKLHFSNSPRPLTGDLRWLSSLDFSGRVGTSVTNYRLDIDYGTIGGFHIPQRLSIKMEGAYSIPIELIGCSVTKQVNVLPSIDLQPEQPEVPSIPVGGR